MFSYLLRTALQNSHSGTPRGEISTEARIEKQKKNLYGLGITEVALGSISIGLSSAADILYENSDHDSWLYNTTGSEITLASTGIWVGVLAIASGVVGICAAKKSNTKLHNANLALSITSAVLMGALTVISIFAAAMVFRPMSVLAIHLTLAVIGFIGMIVSIVHGSNSCMGPCCDRGRNTSDHTGPTVQLVQPQQVVLLPNGQYALLQPLSHGYQGPLLSPPMQLVNQPVNPQQSVAVPMPIVNQDIPGVQNIHAITTLVEQAKEAPPYSPAPPPYTPD